jgi:hypothetical protein
MARPFTSLFTHYLRHTKTQAPKVQKIMALPNQHLASMEAYLQRTHGYLQKAQGTKDKGKKQQGAGGNKFLRKARVFDAATTGEAGVSKATESVPSLGR